MSDFSWSHPHRKISLLPRQWPQFIYIYWPRLWVSGIYPRRSRRLNPIYLQTRAIRYLCHEALCLQSKGLKNEKFSNKDDISLLSGIEQWPYYHVKGCFMICSFCRLAKFLWWRYCTFSFRSNLFDGITSSEIVCLYMTTVHEHENLMISMYTIWVTFWLCVGVLQGCLGPLYTLGFYVSYFCTW